MKSQKPKAKRPKLLATCYSLFAPCKQGMTLVELLVSLVVLMIVLGAVYSIMVMQQTKATEVSKTTILQTDAQVAFTLIKWDLLLAGLGYPYDQQDAIQFQNVVGDSCANLNIRAVGLGFEMDRCRWSYLLDDAKGTQLIVRRWDNPAANFGRGDMIMIINEMRQIAYQNLRITGVDTFRFEEPVWGNEMPASRLFLEIPVSVPQGRMVFVVNPHIYNAGITYRLAGNTLRRGNEDLLNNVEMIQFRYGIDADGDGVIETWSSRNNPPFNPGYRRNWAVRFTMVVTSEGMPGYRYPSNQVTFEDYPGHNYSYPLTTPAQLRQKRAILSGIVYPQNLQPWD